MSTEIVVSADTATRAESIALLVMLLLAWVYIKAEVFWRMGRSIYVARKNIANVHRHYLAIRDYCAKMHEEWMREYVEARDRGLAEERRVREERRTETRTEAKAYTIKEETPWK